MPHSGWQTICRQDFREEIVSNSGCVYYVRDPRGQGRARGTLSSRDSVRECASGREMRGGWCAG